MVLSFWQRPPFVTVSLRIWNTRTPKYGRTPTREHQNTRLKLFCRSAKTITRTGKPLNTQVDREMISELERGCFERSNHVQSELKLPQWRSSDWKGNNIPGIFFLGIKTKSSCIHWAGRWITSGDLSTKDFQRQTARKHLSTISPNEIHDAQCSLYGINTSFSVILMYDWMPEMSDDHVGASLIAHEWGWQMAMCARCSSYANSQRSRGPSDRLEKVCRYHSNRESNGVYSPGSVERESVVSSDR